MERNSYQTDALDSAANRSRNEEPFVKEEGIEESNENQESQRHIKEEHAEGFHQLEDIETRATKRGKYDDPNLDTYPNGEFSHHPQEFCRDGQQNLAQIHDYRMSMTEELAKRTQREMDTRNGVEDEMHGSEHRPTNYVLQEAEGFSSNTENSVYENKQHHAEYSESRSEIREDEYARIPPRGGDLETYHCEWKQEAKDTNNAVDPGRIPQHAEPGRISQHVEIMRTNPICTDSVMTKQPYLAPNQPTFYQIHDMDRPSHIQYECNLCGKNFSQNYDFTNHVYTHMDNMLCKILNAYR